MKLIYLIKLLIVMLLMLLLVVVGVHTLLENTVLVDFNTLLGSFEGVELGMLLLIAVLLGFALGLACGFVLLGASYFKLKRFESQSKPSKSQSASN